MPATSDLIHQTATTTGTGNFTLVAVYGKRSFNTGFGTGGTDLFDYYISSRDAAEWERGTGHLFDATTLVRDTVIASSNANAAVNFSAGTKDVTNDIPAAKQVTTDTVQTLSNKTFDAPALGTPVSANLANCTGLPASALVASTSQAVGFGSIELGHASDTTLARSSAGNLSIEGNVVYRAGGTDVAVADGGTGASTAQAARASLSAASFDAGATLGLLTNPFFEISQENGTTAGAAATAYYAADQWFSLESSDAVLSVQNVADPFSGTATLKRLKNSVKATATTAAGTIGAAQYIQPCVQPVEGTFWASLAWGTADARAIDIVIIAQCSVTGTYPVAIRNAARNRSYVSTISLTANTPAVCLVTVPGDTGGTWVATTSSSSIIDIGDVAGTDFQASSLNTWEAANRVSHSTCTNWAASGTTNFFQVGYCQIFPSGVLPFASASEITGEARQLLLNMRRPHDVELLRCQRYWVKNVAIPVWMTSTTAGTAGPTNTFQMRVTPSSAILNGTGALLESLIAQRDLSTITAPNNLGGRCDITSSAWSAASKMGFVEPNVVSFSARM